MGITWLASYPKSGNTWVRFILSNAIFGPADKSIDVNRRIPDLHRRLPDDRLARAGDGSDDGAPLLAKTHFELSDAHPELSRTDRALHIVRNPRDVLLSALNYRRLNGVTEAQLSDRASDTFAAAFQIAVWEIAEDFDDREGVASLDINRGSFKAKKTNGWRLSGDIVDYIDDLFGSIGSGARDQGLIALKSKKHQDQIIKVVPAPMTLAGFAGVGLAAARRRRRAIRGCTTRPFCIPTGRNWPMPCTG